MGKKDKDKKSVEKNKKTVDTSTASKKNDEPEKDSRFDAFRRNPIYRRIPKNHQRVQIDSRFKSMFQDDGQFKLTYKVDKRGRPIQSSTNENLEKYYHLEEEKEDVDDEEPSEKSDPKPAKLKSKNVQSVPETKDSEEEEPKSDSEEEDKQISEEEEAEIEGNITESQIRKRDKSVKLTKTQKKKLNDLSVDYARGELGFVSDESESDDSSSSEDEEVEDISHAWGELDKDAERTEESTRRLALCNMDWDRVKAVDLMVLFHSFLPTNGVLKCVTIYPSEFGKQRMAEEDIHGPEELRVQKVKEEMEDDESTIVSEDDELEVKDDEEDEEGGSFHMEKLRKYQLNRLKYYYAVLDFDSKETAEKVYTECDRMEYESSATIIDLRFIPEDMEFEESDVKDKCDKLAESDKYRPRYFTTTALQQAKVDLTWDETDPMRRELTEKIFDPKDKVNDDDLRAYLASSSSESEEDVEIKSDPDCSDVEEENKPKADPISKYRALLESIEDKEKKKQGKGVGMEITWGVGLRDKSEKLVKEKFQKEAAAKLTPWEEILAKKKDKSKKKRADKRRGVNGESSQEVKESDDESGEEDDESGSEDSTADPNGEQLFSDDDVDIDLDDPFFKELKEDRKSKKNTKEKKKVEAEDKNEEGNEKTKAELALLLMDEVDDNRHHFNMRKIVEYETASKSKKKRLKKKDWKKNKEMAKAAVEDNFQVDVKDDRFSALFSSHLFNLDPSDPNFKNTNAMKTIVTEKQKRRLVSSGLKEISEAEMTEGQEEVKRKKSKLADAASAAELSFLLKSVKRNTSNLKKKKSKN